MIKRCVVAGLLVGVAFVLVSILPVLTVYLGQLPVPGNWPRVLRSAVIVLNVAAGSVVLASVGSLAAIKSGAADPGQGIKAGVISGIIVGLMFYTLLLAPTAAVAASTKLWAFPTTLQRPYPPDALAFEFIEQTTRAMQGKLWLCLLAGALVGGLEGGIVGLARRREASPSPTLLEVIGSPQPRRRWFSGHDEVWMAGILGGLIGGSVIWLSITVLFYSNLKVEWPALEAVVTERTGVLTRVLFADALLNTLFPLFILAVLGTGGLAVLLLRDPPRRHLSRFQSVIIAGLIVAVMIALAVLPVAFFGLGHAPFGAGFAVQQSQWTDPAGEWYVDSDGMRLMETVVDSPEVLLPLYYLLPLALLALSMFVVLLWIGPQAVFYGLTLPLVVRRPVDRAAKITRAIQSQPSSLLPRVYGLYANDAYVVKVLLHLVFQSWDLLSAEAIAAYHTLSTQADETERSAAVIRRTVSQREGWRWRTEVGELYRILDEGLAAKTLAQVTAIQPPPQKVTSSLPPLLARSCEGIGRVLGELKKVDRVDDLNTKLIFFSSAQAALLDLRRRTDRDSKECQTCETPYPEIPVLHSLMDFWQGIVLTATKDLQGRADIRAELVVPRAGFGPKVRQCVIVTNQGLNVAQNVCLSVANGQGYKVIEGAEQHVDILGPQEKRELEFWVAPDAPQRLRLIWSLTFDDAVDTGRQVDFADAMELEQERIDRPYQRIFPIPYVTGTPLRSGQMFVGRKDTFEFVQEHLLGAYQNNVIVLHGQRRTGKTSILYRLQELMSDSHLGVLIDMQGKAARGTADFLYALSDDIVYTLENHGIFVDLPERAEYEEAPEFTFRSRFLRSVVGQLDDRNLLLMFDEFEELQRRVEDGRLEPEIFPYFRNLMQHEPRLDFLFSGTHMLEDLGAEYWSILFNIAAYKQITFLDSDEIRHLVTEPVAGYGMEYDPLAVERIIQVTAGHPYFAQVVCHEMVAFHNETERSYLTVTHVDQVLERIIERGEAHFKYIWAGATPEEQRVMLALTDLLPDADATVARHQLVEELERKGYDLSQDALTQALAHLQAKDIVTRSGPQSSLYRFKIDLIRRWIRTSRPAL